MANSAMVCTSCINVVPEITPSTEMTISTNKSQQRESPTGTSVESSRMANIRDSLHHQGISSQATALILSSWRKGHTLAAGENGNNGVPRLDIALFMHLQVLFLIFWHINLLKASSTRLLTPIVQLISMTHTPIDGVVVGKHPLVTRLIKGIFNH